VSVRGELGGTDRNFASAPGRRVERNPLSSIQSAAEYITNSGTPEPDVRAASQVIERQLAHMVRLIDDLLDMSRISLKKLILNLEAVELEPILQAGMEASRACIDKRGQRLEYKVATGSVVVNADTVRLPQVISNLLNNASKYSARGSNIVVSTSTDCDTAVISVKDDGIGLGEDQLSDIFELFVQVEQARDGFPRWMIPSRRSAMSQW
jgi:signal transduction histidine kinase